MRNLSTLLILALFTQFVPAQSTALEKPAGTNKKTTVILTLKVEDRFTGSGLSLALKRRFKKGKSAFDAMKKLVVQRNKAGFVESICGVKAIYAKGYYWGLFVNGKYSKVGIASIKLDKNKTILWRVLPAGGRSSGKKE